MSSLRLTQKLQQKMVLTPQLRQRIEMLQMTTLELSELIQTEMNENPTLEEVETGDEILELAEKILDQNADGNEGEFQSSENPDVKQDQVGTDAPDTGAEGQLKDPATESDAAATEESKNEETAEDGDGSDSFEEIDLGREFQDYLDPGYKTQEFEYKEDAPSFDQFLSSSTTLIDHLTWQLHLQQIPERVVEVAESIIGNLDERGRLGIGDEELSLLCSEPVEVVEAARQVVLKLDPVGCGSRDVKECLIAQLIAVDEGESLAVELISEHLEDMQPHRLGHLSKKTGYSVEELDAEIAKVRVLNPYPGKEYSTEAPIYVAPEVYIEKVEGEYVIYFADNGSPRLRISQTYQQLMGQNETTKETKDFIKTKVRSAVDLLRNIEHRRQTIYRVVECIVKRQLAFLDHGVEHIRPMMLKDVAEDIGMHLSTVSRVVNRKYAHTPQGVIELRRFFSEGMMNEDGENVSTRILKLRIKKMVEEEDRKKPLTDDKIAKILGEEGVKLSRRTVAKYRDQMNIPGSRERKLVI